MTTTYHPPPPAASVDAIRARHQRDDGPGAKAAVYADAHADRGALLAVVDSLLADLAAADGNTTREAGRANAAETRADQAEARRKASERRVNDLERHMREALVALEPEAEDWQLVEQAKRIASDRHQQIQRAIAAEARADQERARGDALAAGIDHAIRELERTRYFPGPVASAWTTTTEGQNHGRVMGALAKLRGALAVAQCDHVGIGKPGCPVCDPRRPKRGHEEGALVAHMVTPNPAAAKDERERILANAAKVMAGIDAICSDCGGDDRTGEHDEECPKHKCKVCGNDGSEPHSWACPESPTAKEIAQVVRERDTPAIERLRRLCERYYGPDFVEAADVITIIPSALEEHDAIVAQLRAATPPPPVATVEATFKLASVHPGAAEAPWNKQTHAILDEEARIDDETIDAVHGHVLTRLVAPTPEHSRLARHVACAAIAWDRALRGLKDKIDACTGDAKPEANPTRLEALRAAVLTLDSGAFTSGPVPTHVGNVVRAARALLDATPAPAPAAPELPACPECGGKVERSSAKGMTWNTMGGVRVDVPAHVFVPRCVTCGEDFLSTVDVDAIEAACQAAPAPAAGGDVGDEVERMRRELVDAHNELTKAQVPNTLVTVRDDRTGKIEDVTKVADRVRWLISRYSTGLGRLQRQVREMRWQRNDVLCAVGSPNHKAADAAKAARAMREENARLRCEVNDYRQRAESLAKQVRDAEERGAKWERMIGEGRGRAEATPGPTVGVQLALCPTCGAVATEHYAYTVTLGTPDPGHLRCPAGHIFDPKPTPAAGPGGVDNRHADSVEELRRICKVLEQWSLAFFIGSLEGRTTSAEAALAAERKAHEALIDVIARETDAVGGGTTMSPTERVRWVCARLAADRMAPTGQAPWPHVGSIAAAREHGGKLSPEALTSIVVRLYDEVRAMRGAQ